MADLNCFNDVADHHEMYTINNKRSEVSINKNVDNVEKVFNLVERVQSFNNVSQKVCERNKILSNVYNFELDHYNHLKANLLSFLHPQTEPGFGANHSPINISVWNKSGPEVVNSEYENIAFTDRTLHVSIQVSFKRYRNSNPLEFINWITHNIDKIQIEIKKITHSQNKAETSVFKTMHPNEYEFCTFKNYLEISDEERIDTVENLNKLSSDTENRLTNLKADIETMLREKPFSDINCYTIIDKITCSCDYVGSNSLNNLFQFHNFYAKNRLHIDEKEEADKEGNVSVDVNSYTKEVKIMPDEDNGCNNMRNVWKRARTEDRLTNSYLEFFDNAESNVIRCKSMILPKENDFMYSSVSNIDHIQQENMCFFKNSSSFLTRTTSIETSLAYATVQKLKVLSAKFNQLNFKLLELIESAHTRHKKFKQCKNTGNKSNKITLELTQLETRSLNRRNVSTLSEMRFAVNYDLMENYLNVNDHRNKISQEPKSFVPVNWCHNLHAKENHENSYWNNINSNDNLNEQLLDEISGNTDCRNLNIQMKKDEDFVLEFEHINQKRAITESLLLKNVKEEFHQVLREFMTIKRKLCSYVVDKEETETACEFDDGDANSEHKFTGDKFTVKSFAESLRLQTLTVVAKLVKLFGWSLIKMSACELILAADNESYNNDSVLTINLITGILTKAEHVANIVRPLEEQNVCSSSSSSSIVKQKHFSGNNNNFSDKCKRFETEYEAMAESMHVACSAVNQVEEEVNASRSNAVSGDEKLIDEKSKQLEINMCERQSSRYEHRQENTNDMFNVKGVSAREVLTCINNNTHIELESSAIARELSEIANPLPENVLIKDSKSVENFYCRTNVNEESLSKMENIKELWKPKEKLEQENCVSKSNSETCFEHECITNYNEYPFCDASIDYKNKVIKEPCHESVEQKQSNYEIISYETDIHENAFNLYSVPNEKKQEEQLEQEEEYQYELNTEKFLEREDLQKQSLAEHSECELNIHNSKIFKKEQVSERELCEPSRIYLINSFSKENPDNFKFTVASLVENCELENNKDNNGHDKNVRDTSKKLFDENALWEDDGLEDVITK